MDKKTFSVFFKNLIFEKKIIAKNLAIHLGISEGTISQYKHGLIEPSFDTLKKICEFAGVSLDYFQDPSNTEVVNSPQHIEYLYLPLINHYSMGSFVANESQVHEADYETYPVVYSKAKRYHKNSIVLQIEGNSMGVQLKSGTKVLAEPVDRSNWHYIQSGIYAVVYKDFFVTKRIITNDLQEKKTLTLHSDTEHGGSVTIKEEDIRCVFHIVEIISGLVE